MIRLPAALPSGVILSVCAFLAAAGSPLAAQQAAVAAPVEAVAAPSSVSATPAPVPGPRVRDEMRTVEPSFRASSEPALLRHKSNTITVSTIVLVLAVVILVLLIAR